MTNINDLIDAAEREEVYEMKDRGLHQTCNIYDFSRPLEDTIYCGLGLGGHVIECKYIAKEEDHNGLRPCTNPWYQIEGRGHC